jgi:peptidoglycan-associated lipoprotein
MGGSVALGLGLLIVCAGLLAGCGGKKEVETNPAETEPAMTEDLDRPVVPETEPEEAPAEQPPPRDYSLEEPQQYGVRDVFFAFDKSELDQQAMDDLARNARILREVGTTVLIEGHCDERGTVEYNLALGERRAMAVRDYLVSLGVASYRLDTVSYGESRPFVQGHNEQAWAQNRRAHFTRP